MTATMVLRYSGHLPTKAPRRLGEVGEVLLGTCVGATFNRALLVKLGDLLPGVILAALGLVFTSVFTTWLLSRTTLLSLATALFSLAPGGMPEMVAICEECNADMAVVAILQFLRYICVLTLVPMVVAWLSS
jgi:membrane AbrB-like protein